MISYLLRGDFAEVGAAEPYSEGIIDYLRAVEGADMAALIREPPRERRAGSAREPARLDGRARRLEDRACVRSGGWAPPGGRVLERRLDRGDHRVHPPRVRRGSKWRRKGAQRPGGARPLRQAGRAFVVRDRAAAARADRRAGGACGNARPVRDRAPARPARELHEGGAAVRRAAEAVRDGGRPLADDVHGRSRGRSRRRARASVAARARGAAGRAPRRDRPARSRPPPR